MLGALDAKSRRDFIDRAHRQLSVIKQCELLSVNRSTIYYEGQDAPSLEEVVLMNKIRDIWLDKPFYGYRRVTVALKKQGEKINRKRVQRLMQIMGIQAIHPKPKTTTQGDVNYIYPYLLKDLSITAPNQVWCVDITYLKVPFGMMYLVALIDVYSRYIVGWTLSNTLDAEHSISAFEKALKIATPDIINSDQGSQYTVVSHFKRRYLCGFIPQYLRNF